MYIYIYTYIYIYIYIYTYIRTSFDRGRFQENLFSFKKHKLLQKILFVVICFQIRHNAAAFFLTTVDENYMNWKRSYWTLDIIYFLV